jgi:hypothetical protein
MATDKSSERSDRLNELKEHAMGLREFEGPDWDGTQEDLELLWNIREALSRSVEKSELEERVPSEPAKESELHESYELPVNVELLLAELDATPVETNIEVKQKEKAENAERPL